MRHPQNSASLRWKYKELITALGGPQGVADRLSERGIAPPPASTIRGWQTRSSVPGRYSPLLIMIAQEVGVLRDIRHLRAGRD